MSIPSGCYNCEQPDGGCGGVEGQSKYATASKCGAINPADNKFYKTIVNTTTYSGSVSGSISTTTNFTISDSGVCSSTTSGCEGGLSYTAGYSSSNCGPWHGPNGTVDSWDGFWAGASGYSSTGSSVFSNEDSDSNVIGRATDKANGLDFTASMPETSAHLTGSSYTLEIAQARFSHQPTATCYLKVWFRDVVVTTDSSGTTTTNIDDPIPPYEWIGGGSPCFANKDKQVNDDANKISTEWNDIPLPSPSAGQSITRTRTVRKCSFIKGYTPDDPDKDGKRPSPDNKPNMFPDPTKA